MNIFAKVIADSITVYGTRLTTMEIALPKVILAEFNTHRVFSRNFSSSRAIPNAKLVNQDSFEPTFYGKNVAGMKALNEEIENVDEAKVIWENAIQYCKNASKQLADLGLHKQWANRLNDWHTMARGIVSSTDWDNFFALRDHSDAQPEIRTLAVAMKTALEQSTPVKLKSNEWHLPYITEQEKSLYRDDALCRMSAARCCRVSYLKHDGDRPSVEEDLNLCKKLAGSVPIHASPFEHVAQPLKDPLKKSGNFRGWLQYREIIENELKQKLCVGEKDINELITELAEKNRQIPQRESWVVDEFGPTPVPRPTTPDSWKPNEVPWLPAPRIYGNTKNAS